MAAAYAALVSLLNNLELIQSHPHHSLSFENKQIQSLLQIVNFLIEFLESHGNFDGPSKEAAQLLITRAAHAAEEVIESHVVDQIRGGSTLDGKRRSCFLLDVQRVTEDMDFVKRKAIKITKESEIKLKLQQPMYSSAATSSTPLTSQKSSMVGFDEVFLQLLDLLTGQPSSRRVISIVGTGGIGKTTLARNAFEHSLIVQRFDIRLWASISQHYVVEEILLQLLSRKERFNSETVGQLGEQLHKKLFGRRYLIVLDDMWSVQAWGEMKFLFPDNSNGSRVVVTSRQSRVGDHLGSSCLAISFLDEDKSWALFCEKAFGRKGCPPELEEVGKKIVKKCKGLPLAIVVVAGHLGKSSRVQEYWENVANNMNSILNSEENKQFLDVLSFSYSHLPVHLKPCFIYMGTYPEDEHIDVRSLIKRWIAEGFLKPCRAKNMEEIAYDYLKDLIDRNLIFPSTSLHTRRWQGEVECVGIHDLLRELCIKVAEKEKFFYVVDTPRAICRERQVVRSLQWEEGEESFDLRFLRVLYKHEVSPNEVGGGFLKDDLQQVNLRCIEYRRDFFEYKSDCFLYFPSPLCLLWNLQSLIITLGSRSFIAPYEIWEMPQLRNVEVLSGIHLPLPLPCDNLDRVMQNMQTLWNVENLKLSEEVCKRIPNIKELRLKYFDTGEEFPQSQSSSCYCLNNLGNFHKLESLICRFGLSSKTAWREFGLSLTFPSSLKNLTLTGSRLKWEEMTMMVGSLPRLETLELYVDSAIGSEWTLVEGKFPCLKYLRISYCDDLVLWNVESSHFPVLERLDLISLCRLDEFPSGIGEIPTLGCICLIYCNVNLMMSAMRTVMEREEEQGDEDLRLELDFLSGREGVESFNKKMEEEGVRVNNLRQSYKEKDVPARGNMGVHFFMRDVQVF